MPITRSLRNKLLARSDEYISTVLEQAPPQLSKYGLMIGTMRATVKVRDVQRALNQISRDDRIEFIRNNGDPHIAVSIRALGAGGRIRRAPPQRSAVAENILKEHIRSFGFVTVDDELAKPPADFLVDGEVRFKKLSAKLAASGLTIEKFVLTSWTYSGGRCEDRRGDLSQHHDPAEKELGERGARAAGGRPTDRRRVLAELFSAVLRLQAEKDSAAILGPAASRRERRARRDQRQSDRAERRARYQAPAGTS